uniref:THUMP domain-containing protein n=1 Tax=Anopheles darlingi TaxID=43151 RepID=A0A2M4CIS3_ANODA
MSEPKKMRMDSAAGKGNNGQRKGKPGKRNFYNKSTARFMQPGQRGFLVTCNGRLHDCIRDSYRILNEYADLLYGAAPSPNEAEPAANEKSVDDESEEEDISVTLQKEAAAAGIKKPMRFQNVDSGATNCLFIRTTLKEPTALAHKVLQDLSTTRKAKSRFILRMVPIEAVCRANLKDIIDTVGSLSDRHFLKEPKTYAIIYNHRLNNELPRDDVIRELADLISSKNAGNKANLKNPELAVIVEVIKGLCCIGIVPEYYTLRKYNLAEIVAQQPPPVVKGDSATDQKPAEEKPKEVAEEPVATVAPEKEQA